MDVIKTIIPAAGVDTAFLPVTKAIPKEMMPILEKPAIQYVIEEALRSQISNFLVVTGKGKQAIADYFDSSYTLDMFLNDNQRDLISGINKIIEAAEFTYMRQSEPLGSGHAVWLARHCIQKEYFGVMMPDDIILSKVSALAQLIRVARQEKSSVIAVQEVPSHCSSQYGMIEIKKQITPNLFQVAQIHEKPSPKDSPSNIAVIGRYVLSHKIFPALDDMRDISDNLSLTEAVNSMMRKGEKVFAYKVSGMRFDVGTPAGWIKAVLGMALQDDRYAENIQQFIKEIDTPDSFLYNSNKTIEHNL